MSGFLDVGNLIISYPENLVKIFVAQKSVTFLTLKEGNMAKLLIFDFDGTIADTKSVYYNVIENELRRYGFDKVKADSVIDTGMSLRKTLKNLHLNFISSWLLHKRIIKQVEHYTLRVKKCKDVDSIGSIDEEKILITNSLREFAVPILRHLKIKRYFNEVYGADDFDDKTEFISDYLKKNKINRRDCYYIGDRVADVKLARKAGIKSVIVCGKCAWNSKKDILKANPDFIIDDLADLGRIMR